MRTGINADTWQLVYISTYYLYWTLAVNWWLWIMLLAYNLNHNYANMQYNTLQYNTLQYNTLQYNTLQYNTLQYNTLQYNTLQYNTLQYTKIQYTKIQYTKIRYTTIQYNAFQVIIFYIISLDLYRKLLMAKIVTIGLVSKNENANKLYFPFLEHIWQQTQFIIY